MAASVERSSRGIISSPIAINQRIEKTTTFIYFNFLNDDTLIKISQFISGRSIAIMAMASRHWAITLLPSIKLEHQTSLLVDFRNVDLQSDGFMQQVGIDPNNFSLELRNYTPLQSRVIEIFLSRFLKHGKNHLQGIPVSLLLFSKNWAYNFYSKISQSIASSKWEHLEKYIKDLSRAGYFIPAIQTLQFVPENIEGVQPHFKKQLLEAIFIEIFKSHNTKKFLEAFKEIPNQDWQLGFKEELIQKIVRKGYFEIAVIAIENLPDEEQFDYFRELIYAYIQKGNIEKAKEIARKIPEEEHDILEAIDRGNFPTERQILEDVQNLIIDCTQANYVAARNLASRIFDNEVKMNALRVIESARNHFDPYHSDDDIDEGDDLEAVGFAYANDTDEGDEGDLTDVYDEGDE